MSSPPFLSLGGPKTYEELSKFWLYPNRSGVTPNVTFLFGMAGGGGPPTALGSSPGRSGLRGSGKAGGISVTSTPSSCALRVLSINFSNQSGFRKGGLGGGATGRAKCCNTAAEFEVASDLGPLVFLEAGPREREACLPRGSPEVERLDDVPLALAVCCDDPTTSE